LVEVVQTRFALGNHTKSQPSTSTVAEIEFVSAIWSTTLRTVLGIWQYCIYGGMSSVAIGRGTRSTWTSSALPGRVITDPNRQFITASRPVNMSGQTRLGVSLTRFDAGKRRYRGYRPASRDPPSAVAQGF
jgi:hypothetical protein